MKARIPLVVSGAAVVEHFQKTFQKVSPKDFLQVKVTVRSANTIELYCTILRDEQEITGYHQAVAETLNVMRDELEKLGLEGEYEFSGKEHEIVFTNIRAQHEEAGRFIPEVTAETHIAEMMAPLIWESKVENIAFGVTALVCHGKILAVTSSSIGYTWIYKETIWGTEAVEQNDVPRGDLIRNQGNLTVTVHDYVKAVSTLQKLGISF